MENQLTILSESLDKKLEVLQKIREYNKRQEEIFSAEEVDMSLFDDAVEEKQRLIDEVVHLDEGFEIMYEKLARELEGNRQRYAAQIRELQTKVSQGDRTQRVRTGTGSPEQETGRELFRQGTCRNRPETEKCQKRV